MPWKNWIVSIADFLRVWSKSGSVPVFPVFQGFFLNNAYYNKWIPNTIYSVIFGKVISQ